MTAVAFKIAQQSIATYYPEGNVLVALDHYHGRHFMSRSAEMSIESVRRPPGRLRGNV
jgi:hypothetical protein